MQLKDFPQVKVLLFDLGGVVINIDWYRSIRAFSSLTTFTKTEIIKVLKEDDFVFRIETGALSQDEFRKWFVNKFDVKVTNSEIDDAWNAMLLDIPPIRINWLKRLKSSYQLMCLSNTNAIHINKLNIILSRSTEYSNLNQILHRCFYSHELKMRKPDKIIFEQVINEIGLNPNEILYFEDNQNNYEQALHMGMNAVLVTQENTLEKIFDEQVKS